MNTLRSVSDQTHAVTGELARAKAKVGRLEMRLAATKKAADDREKMVGLPREHAREVVTNAKDELRDFHQDFTDAAKGLQVSQLPVLAKQLADIERELYGALRELASRVSKWEQAWIGDATGDRTQRLEERQELTLYIDRQIMREFESIGATSRALRPFPDVANLPVARRWVRNVLNYADQVGVTLYRPGGGARLLNQFR